MKDLPFPVKLAEEPVSAAVEVGGYSDAMQLSDRSAQLGSDSITWIETATGGHNDTDQDSD